MNKDLERLLQKRFIILEWLQDIESEIKLLQENFKLKEKLNKEREEKKDEKNI